MKIKIVCTTCGSTDVRRNCDAAWDEKTQKWEIVALFDTFTCEKCGGECNVEEKPLKD